MKGLTRSSLSDLLPLRRMVALLLKHERRSSALEGKKEVDSRPRGEKRFEFVARLLLMRREIGFLSERNATHFSRHVLRAVALPFLKLLLPQTAFSCSPIES